MVNQETGERTPFQVLTEGACFNFYTSVLGYQSLFEVVAHTNARLLVLDRDDLFELSRSDMNVLDVIKKVQSENIVKGVKYDFFFLYQEADETEPNSEMNSTMINKSDSRNPKSVRHVGKYHN